MIALYCNYIATNTTDYYADENYSFSPLKHLSSPHFVICLRMSSSLQRALIQFEHLSVLVCECFVRQIKLIVFQGG